MSHGLAVLEDDGHLPELLAVCPSLSPSAISHALLIFWESPTISAGLLSSCQAILRATRTPITQAQPMFHLARAREFSMINFIIVNSSGLDMKSSPEQLTLTAIEKRRMLGN